LGGSDCQRGLLRGAAIYFFPANARKYGTIDLISSGVSSSLKAGILLFRTPSVMASRISSSVVCFCHLLPVKLGALYLRPLTVSLLPFLPWPSWHFCVTQICSGVRGG